MAISCRGGVEHKSRPYASVFIGRRTPRGKRAGPDPEMGLVRPARSSSDVDTFVVSLCHVAAAIGPQERRLSTRPHTHRWRTVPPEHHPSRSFPAPFRPRCLNVRRRRLTNPISNLYPNPNAKLLSLASCGLECRAGNGWIPFTRPGTAQQTEDQQSLHQTGSKMVTNRCKHRQPVSFHRRSVTFTTRAISAPAIVLDALFLSQFPPPLSPLPFFPSAPYQIRLGRQRQVWFIQSADERGVCR